MNGLTPGVSFKLNLKGEKKPIKDIQIKDGHLDYPLPGNKQVSIQWNIRNV